VRTILQSHISPNSQKSKKDGGSAQPRFKEADSDTPLKKKLFEEKKSDLTEDQLAALVRATSSDADNVNTLEKKDLMLTT
jgi:hypothetical protein